MTRYLLVLSLLLLSVNLKAEDLSTSSLQGILCRINQDGEFERGAEFKNESCEGYKKYVASVSKDGLDKLNVWWCWVMDPCFKRSILNLPLEDSVELSTRTLSSEKLCKDGTPLPKDEDPACEVYLDFFGKMPPCKGAEVCRLYSDGSYKSYDGCNWSNCNKSGLCDSTMLFCPKDWRDR